MGIGEIASNMHFNQYKSSVLVEIVGTFMLVLTASLATNSDAEVAPLAVGFVLMAMIFGFGYISGGHFNPAVTVAAFLCDKPEDMAPFEWHKALLYFIAQFGGAVGAAIYLLFIVGYDFPVPMIANDPLTVFRAFIAESVYTFVLASVVMHVALSVQRHNEFYGFAIGMAVMSAAFGVGGISGGAFNPAVAIGLIVTKCVAGLRCDAMIHLWLYPVAELVGALVAVVLYNSVTKALAEEHGIPARRLDSPKSQSAAEMASVSKEQHPAVTSPPPRRPQAEASDERHEQHNASGESSLEAKRPAPIDLPEKSPAGMGTRMDARYKDDAKAGPLKSVPPASHTPKKAEAPPAKPVNKDDVSPLEVDDDTN